MGFWDWWENKQDEDSSGSQLDIFGNSQNLSERQRLDGKIVHKDFQNAIKSSGGSQAAYPRAVQTETQELFDCNVKQLYNQLGGREGDRSTLPKDVQKAYAATEIRASYELKATSDSFSRHPEQRDDQIVETVRESAKQTRKWLPW